MKIVVLGMRGFPGVQGGVEKHCENIYPILAQKGVEVIVLARRPYVGEKSYEYKGVKIVPVSCPRNKFLEAFVHTFNGLLAAKKYKPDLIHVHAIGPALFVPMARLMGFKVVITHHGPDYDRKKWNRLAKFVLMTGERWGCMGANRVICISNAIAESVKKKFKVEARIILNGVNIPRIEASDTALQKYGLDKGRYLLAVGRFVPEKGFSELVQAFNEAKITGWKLVIVGDADHEDKHSLELKELAKRIPGVVLTGFLSGAPLWELYSHAGVFVLPSYYEGLPIVLLEAMSYGLSCIVSDIPANREVDPQEDRFFKPGDVRQLAEKIKEFILKPLTKEEKARQVSFISENYDWERIASQTFEVYKSVVCD